MPKIPGWTFAVCAVLVLTLPPSGLGAQTCTQASLGIDLSDADFTCPSTYSAHLAWTASNAAGIQISVYLDNTLVEQTVHLGSSGRWAFQKAHTAPALPQVIYVVAEPLVSSGSVYQVCTGQSSGDYETLPTSCSSLSARIDSCSWSPPPYPGGPSDGYCQGRVIGGTAPFWTTWRDRYVLTWNQTTATSFVSPSLTCHPGDFITLTVDDSSSASDTDTEPCP